MPFRKGAVDSRGCLVYYTQLSCHTVGASFHSAITSDLLRVRTWLGQACQSRIVQETLSTFPPRPPPLSPSSYMPQAPPVTTPNPSESGFVLGWETPNAIRGAGGCVYGVGVCFFSGLLLARNSQRQSGTPDWAQWLQFCWGVGDGGIKKKKKSATARFSALEPSTSRLAMLKPEAEKHRVWGCKLS